MKYFQLSVFYLFFFFSFAGAQNFTITWADDEKKVQDVSDAVALSNGNYMLLKIPYMKPKMFSKDFTSNPICVLANAQMQTIREQSIDVSESGDATRELRKVGNEIFLTYKVSDKRQTSVYAIKIDQETLKAREKKTLATIEGDQFDYWPETKFVFSPDSSHLLLLVEGYGKKKENKQVFLAVFDRGFNRVWSRYQELPIGTRSISIEDYAVSNGGKVYLATKHYEKDIASFRIIGKGPKIPPYQYKFFVCSMTGIPKQIDVLVDGYYIGGTRILFDKTGSLRLAGLYGKNPSGRLSGAFYTSFDSLASTIRPKELLAFPEDILKSVATDNQGKSSGSDPGVNEWLRINHILLRQNGTVDIISEVQIATEQLSKDNDGNRTGPIYYTYEYGDILVISLSKENQATYTRIPKMQETSYTTRGLSYFPIFYGNNLLLLYNDMAINSTRDISKSPFIYTTAKKDAVLLAAIIDEKGNLTRKALYNFREEKRVTIPTYFERLSNGKIFLLSAWGGAFSAPRLGFGSLEIK